MTAREALSILARPSPDEREDQAAVDHFTAVEVVALALNLHSEAAMAKRVVTAIQNKDEAMVLLDALLDGDGRDGQ